MNQLLKKLQYLLLATFAFSVPINSVVHANQMVERPKEVQAPLQAGDAENEDEEEEEQGELRQIGAERLEEGTGMKAYVDAFLGWTTKQYSKEQREQRLWLSQNLYVVLDKFKEEIQLLRTSQDATQKAFYMEASRQIKEEHIKKVIAKKGVGWESYDADTVVKNLVGYVDREYSKQKEVYKQKHAKLVAKEEWNIKKYPYWNFFFGNNCRDAEKRVEYNNKYKAASMYDRAMAKSLGHTKDRVMQVGSYIYSVPSRAWEWFGGSKLYNYDTKYESKSTEAYLEAQTEDNIKFVAKGIWALAAAWTISRMYTYLKPIFSWVTTATSKLAPAKETAAALSTSAASLAALFAIPGAGAAAYYAASHYFGLNPWVSAGIGLLTSAATAAIYVYMLKQTNEEQYKNAMRFVLPTLTVVCAVAICAIPPALAYLTICGCEGIGLPSWIPYTAGSAIIGANYYATVKITRSIKQHKIKEKVKELGFFKGIFWTYKEGLNFNHSTKEYEDVKDVPKKDKKKPVKLSRNKKIAIGIVVVLAAVALGGWGSYAYFPRLKDKELKDRVDDILAQGDNESSNNNNQHASTSDSLGANEERKEDS